MPANPAFIVAIAVGSLMLLSVCFVYIRFRELKTGGVILAGFGVILLGMSVWKSIDVSFGKDGVKAKLEQIQGTAENAARSAEAAQHSSTELRATVTDIQNRIDLAAAQAQLSTLGLYHGAPDGFKGIATEAALRRFQAANALPTTGVLDGQTSQLLKDKALASPVLR